MLSAYEFLLKKQSIDDQTNGQFSSICNALPPLKAVKLIELWPDAVPLSQLVEDDAFKGEPTICKILKVHVGEKFRIFAFSQFKPVIFSILPDGTFQTDPENFPKSSVALLEAIQNPDKIIKVAEITINTTK